MVSTKCNEVTGPNQLIDYDNEEVIQSSNVQCIHKVDFEKDFIELLVEYAVAYEKAFHIGKHADTTCLSILFYVHEQNNVLEYTRSQGYRAKKIFK